MTADMNLYAFLSRLTHQDILLSTATAIISLCAAVT